MLKSRRSSELPRMIGFEEVFAFIQQEPPSLTPARTKAKAKIFYVTLFRATRYKQLRLCFICWECKKSAEVCRCEGECFRGDWVHTEKPQEVATRWGLTVDSVLALSKAQINAFQAQTATRIHRFVAYVEQMTK